MKRQRFSKALHVDAMTSCNMDELQNQQLSKVKRTMRQYYSIVLKTCFCGGGNLQIV